MSQKIEKVERHHRRAAERMRALAVAILAVVAWLREVLVGLDLLKLTSWKNIEWK